MRAVQGHAGDVPARMAPRLRPVPESVVRPLSSTREGTMRYLRWLRCWLTGHRMTLTLRTDAGWTYTCAHKCGKSAWIRRTTLKPEYWT